MDLSRCSCDKAGFCPVFRRDMDEKNHHWCKISSEEKRTNYYKSNVARGIQNNESYLDKVKLNNYLPIQYDIPKNIDEIEIVTFHFNPSGSSRLKNTYYEWIESLRNLGSYVKCYEIVFDDREPEIKNSIVIRASLEKNCLWQKESLINFAFKNISSDKKYFAWVDHDLPFENPKWIKETIEKLENECEMVQLFEEVVYLDKDGKKSHCSIGRSNKMKNQKAKFISRNAHGCPGGGWAGKINILKKVFPIPSIIIGSGDEWLAYGIYCTKNISKPMQDQLEIYSKSVQDSLMGYIDKICKMKIKTDFVKGRVYHLWHGDPKNRQYTTRHEIMQKNNFDPNQDVFINENGILELAGNNPGIEKDLLKYFKERKEDG